METGSTYLLVRRDRCKVPKGILIDVSRSSENIAGVQSDVVTD